MNDTWQGAIVGFLLGTVIGGLAVNMLFGGFPQETVFGLAIMCGPAVGVMGALIGAYVGSEKDLRNRSDGRMNHPQHSDSHQTGGPKSSKYRTCLHCGLKTNAIWRERCRICGKLLVPIPPPK